MNHILTHDFGKSFPPAMSFGGYVFLIAGILALTKFIPLGIIFLLLGILLTFSKSGIQINTTDNTYRSYNSWFGVKQGKWKSIKNWSYLTLLINRSQTAVSSLSNRRTLTPIDIFYEITLIDKTKSRKLAIKRLKDKDIAVSDLNDLSQKLNLPIIKYPANRAPKRKK